MKKWIPFLVLLLLMALAYLFGVTKYFTFENLQKNRQIVMGIVTEHWILSPLLFIAIYTMAVALSLPIATFLSLIGGFLFPQPLSTLYIVLGATSGAVIVFLAAKTAFGNLLKEKAGPLFQKIERGFQENNVSYLLFLRLVPLFPFWLVNLAPAFLGIKLHTFIWTTFIGIIPGAFVFAQAGEGLGAILDSQGGLSINTIFNWKVKIALIALGIFMLLPILIKKIRKKNDR